MTKRISLVVLAVVLFTIALTGAAFGQQTQSTCQVYGNTVTCTSTDNGATIAERNRENAEAGNQIGRALGAGLGRGIHALRQRHQNKKEEEARRRYCDGTTPAWCAAYGK